MRLTLIYSILSCVYLSITVALAVSLSKPGCPESCGNVVIPYPFGVGPECSGAASYTVTCRNSTHPPKPFISSINLELLNVSIETGTVTVLRPVTPLDCDEEQRPLPLERMLSGSSFTVSELRNSLTLLGCNKSIWLLVNDTVIRGCIAICDAESRDFSCNGVNCCQTSIPKGGKDLQLTVYKTVGTSRDRRSCGYAFFAEKKWFPEDYKTYRGLLEDLSNPFDEAFRFASVVLEWEHDSVLSEYSSCKYVKGNTSTRACSCNVGFQGNPYLQEGCQDIDECTSLAWNHCSTGTCINTIGSYICHPGHKGNVVLMGVVSAFGALILLIGPLGSYRIVKKKIKDRRKKKFFARNGGLMLERRVSSTSNVVENTKLFSVEELEQATDHYDENRVIGCGSQGTVYKGMLKDGRIVAVKKSKKVDLGDVAVFINEVTILSQINHRHIVRLLGCCLETEVPILLYEFIPNGTLFQHVHDPNEDFPLTWEKRVRIATQVAGAISYLHSGASAPIYHRDIKSSNILLDEKYQAKVADFGTSRSLSIDQTHLTTKVLGTFGYFDPQYFQSSKFTDKSDVYSFGVVMVELLTGEKAISSTRAEEGRSLVTDFLHSIEENHLFDILDARVLREGHKEDIVATAELARGCLNLSRKKRPTMKEVEVELERIHASIDRSDTLQHSYNDTEFHSIDFCDDYDISSSSE